MNDLRDKNWIIEQERYDPGCDAFNESVFFLGNGYMGVRGFEGMECGKKEYEQCSYIAGIFDYFKPGITDMVNTPNFMAYRLFVGGAEVNLANAAVTGYYRVLNMREGTLSGSLTLEDERGFKTKIDTVRFLSLARIHNAAVRYCVTPLNYSAEISLELAIDGRVSNNPISDDQSKNDVSPVTFLHEVGRGFQSGPDGKDAAFLVTAGSVADYSIAEAFSVELSEAIGKQDAVLMERVEKDRYIAVRISFNAIRGMEYVLDKFISVYTSRDQIGSGLLDETVSSALAALRQGFEVMRGSNADTWAKKWEMCDVVIEGDDKSQNGIRYNIFQMVQSNAENDPKVSIGARGLTHGRYKGCYFWDTDIFLLPFYTYVNPKAAKNLLLYRYNTLPGAEENARRQNLEGARYAWMCTLDGLEQCETWDIGCCEVHITADVAYAVSQYFEITGDEEFIRDYGAEIYIKTARYWKSRFTYRQDKDAYNMLFVKGPNEYGGVTENNTYTTMMAVNNFRLAISAVSFLKEKYGVGWLELKQKIGFEESEMEKWKDIMEKAVINYDARKKLYIEDGNFMKLERVNMEELKTGNTPLYHKISFDRLQRYMVLKQADVILLMALLPELFTEGEKKAAWDFYEPITLHDSTLSFGTHALFAARLGLKEKAGDYFYKSVRLDLDDIMGNTGKEGIHFASLGASWQAVVNGFAGIKPCGGHLEAAPNLPDNWKLLKFKLLYGGKPVSVEITKDGAIINAVS